MPRLWRKLTVNQAVLVREMLPQILPSLRGSRGEHLKSQRKGVDLENYISEWPVMTSMQICSLNMVCLRITKHFEDLIDMLILSSDNKAKMPIMWEYFPSPVLPFQFLSLLALAPFHFLPLLHLYPSRPPSYSPFYNLVSPSFSDSIWARLVPFPPYIPPDLL
jgi:hypothetical protein